MTEHTATREEIIKAIAEAVNAETGFAYLPSDRLLRDMATEAYRAVEPFLAERAAEAAAAERGRIRQLAVERHALYLQRGDPQSDGEPAGMMPFADLLAREAES